MGLFGKKPDCPICGNPTPRLLPTKIEGQPICKECDGKHSMQQELLDEITLEQFKEHLAFREENAKLYKAFHGTRKETFVDGQCNLVIDDAKKLFYFDKGEENPTIFHFSDLQSIRYVEVPNVKAFIFDIPETYHKTVLEYTREYRSNYESYAKMLESSMMRCARFGKWDENFYDADNTEIVLERPVDTFRIEVNFSHPYWKRMKFEYLTPSMMQREDGPSRFDIEDYQRNCTKIVNDANRMAEVMGTILDEES